MALNFLMTFQKADDNDVIAKRRDVNACVSGAHQ
jgi:hypothetical protein